MIRFSRSASVCAVALVAIPAAAKTDTFAAFWRQFRPAAVRGDIGVMTRLTRLPFQFKTTITDADGLRPGLKLLFDAKTRTCFARTKPHKDGNYYSVTCGGRQFGFDANEGAFQFSGVQPSD